MSGTSEAEEEPGGATDRIAAVLADRSRDDIAPFPRRPVG